MAFYHVLFATVPCEIIIQTILVHTQLQIRGKNIETLSIPAHCTSVVNFKLLLGYLGASAYPIHNPVQCPM